MALVDYTSFEDVRAALGVSVDELSDATLSLNLYEYNLVSELEGIDINLIPDFESTKEVDSASRTANQTRFLQSVNLFSTYAVAKQATAALPMFSPKDQTDGKAALNRFGQDPYKVTTDRVNKLYEQYKAKLEVVFEAIRPTAPAVVSTRPYLSVVTPGYDPITGV